MYIINGRVGVSESCAIFHVFLTEYQRPGGGASIGNRTRDFLSHLIVVASTWVWLPSAFAAYLTGSAKLHRCTWLTERRPSVLVPATRTENHWAGYGCEVLLSRNSSTRLKRCTNPPPTDLLSALLPCDGLNGRTIFDDVAPEPKATHPVTFWPSQRP